MNKITIVFVLIPTLDFFLFNVPLVPISYILFMYSNEKYLIYIHSFSLLNYTISMLSQRSHTDYSKSDQITPLNEFNSAAAKCPDGYL